MTVTYNSPVILSFSIIIFVIHLLNVLLFPGLTYTFLTVRPQMSLLNHIDYFRLIFHVLGHGSWEHLFNNVIYLLLLGPILEEKYGSPAMLAMMAITALSAGIINVLVFSTGLMGASSIVFMLIILISIVDIKEGTIPVTFLVVATIFIGREMINALNEDNISQAAHIVGGSLGAFFGFYWKKGIKIIKHQKEKT